MALTMGCCNMVGCCSYSLRSTECIPHDTAYLLYGFLFHWTAHCDVLVTVWIKVLTCSAALLQTIVHCSSSECISLEDIQLPYRSCYLCTTLCTDEFVWINFLTWSMTSLQAIVDRSCSPRTENADAWVSRDCNRLANQMRVFAKTVVDDFSLAAHVSFNKYKEYLRRSASVYWNAYLYLKQSTWSHRRYTSHNPFTIQQVVVYCLTGWFIISGVEILKSYRGFGSPKLGPRPAAKELTRPDFIRKSLLSRFTR